MISIVTKGKNVVELVLRFNTYKTTGVDHNVGNQSVIGCALSILNMSFFFTFTKEFASRCLFI